MERENSIEVVPAAASEAKPSEPCLLVIFGASGDLTRRELVPSLVELSQRRLLPERFAIVGFARRDWDDQRFRDAMREPVVTQCGLAGETWERFARALHFVKGDFRSPALEDYAELRRRIGEIQGEDPPHNLLFHLAVPPSFFPTIIRRLGEAGLARSDEGWRRLVIEKPFGESRRSASELDRTIREVFADEQIYRIDHFLGKETVQNMIVFRFANPNFEPIWNRDHVDHVQITVAEDIGIGTRAEFYEKTGIVRDMVQNHLLQLLCLTAIEPPVRFGPVALRDETAKVLDAVEPLDVDRDVVLGQYGPGQVNGEPVPGYRDEEGVAAVSTTPTYAAMRVRIDNWRWAGVPFFLRTGKRMSRKLTKVSLHFRPTPHSMFGIEESRRYRHVLAFRVQPDEGIVYTFAAKTPGPVLSIERVRMNFRYAEAFGAGKLPRAYAWLLYDAMEGDPTLFARSDWIDRAWSIADPIVERSTSDPASDFPNYRAGSRGPARADELLRVDGREWEEIGRL